MFNKKEDNWLKITNMLLVIVLVLSLGVAIGNNIYVQSDNIMSCNFGSGTFGIGDYEKQGNADYKASCYYARNITEDNSYKAMYIGYSLFATSLTGLIICNLFKKKD